MLSIVILSFFLRMMSVTVKSVMLSIVMLSLFKDDECHSQAYYAEWRYPKCWYAECISQVCYADYYYTECL